MNIGSDPDLRQNRNLLWLLAVGSIPIGIVGYLFDKQADTTWRQPYVIGTMLILVGIVMWIAEKRRIGSKSMSTIQMGDGIAVGLAQACAVIPGHLAQRLHHQRRPVSQHELARQRRAFPFCFPRPPSPRRC